MKIALFSSIIPVPAAQNAYSLYGTSDLHASPCDLSIDVHQQRSKGSLLSPSCKFMLVSAGDVYT